MGNVIIIGAGLSGLSAAMTLAEKGQSCLLVSAQPSERAQSVLAEGGFNAAADTMGENDSTALHFEDTMKGGVYLADPNACAALAENAPKLLEKLISLGAAFNMADGKPVLRNFGGQKKKRTAYAKASTGKMIMSALIDEVRRYESTGLVTRYPHHKFVSLIVSDGECCGVFVQDIYTKKITAMFGSVILCCGGMNGFFPEMTTGTTANSGYVQAEIFSQGVAFANLEMLQYHPTTIGIPGKRCLVTEAARGEGGRLFIKRNGGKYYFMEEKYPELKNLMPRDVVSREMYLTRRQTDCEGEVMLDMTGLSEQVWSERLPDLRQELKEQLGLDPAKEPVPVREGIHYFMGGIFVDEFHRTCMRGLYAAGECACQYHGANRLGGNSMLGAVYGGSKAAQQALADGVKSAEGAADTSKAAFEEARPAFIKKISDILLGALGIVRNEQTLRAALDELGRLSGSNSDETARLELARAMLMSAAERRESRGAHFREDYPEKDERLRRTLVAQLKNGEVALEFRDLPERRVGDEAQT